MSRSCCLLALASALLAGQSANAESLAATPMTPFAAQDFRGREYKLEEFHDKKLVVVAFLGIECPLAKLYSSRLQKLAAEYADKGLVVIGVDANRQDAPTEIDSFVRRQEIQYPFLIDVGGKIAEQFGATRTPEVFLLDEQRVVRYRGRVDDQYQIGVVRDRADHQELKTAIDELLADKPVTVASTQPTGCLIGKPRTANENSEVTWSKQISRIFQNRCQECHRKGDIGPFALMDYEEAAGWGEMIAEVVTDGRMPPWHANPDHGHFSNARVLPDEEKQQILAWVKNGCPKGNDSDLPEPRQFVAGWQLSREPDQVFMMADKPFQVPAEAGKQGVRYQNFEVDPQITEDKWVTGAEVLPGNPAVVHHIIVFVLPPNGEQRRNEVFFSAYVPGLRARKLPEGVAKKIPAGSHLRFQVHYTPNGAPQEDISKIGLVYTDAPNVTQEIITTECANVRFALEPNKRDQEVSAKSAKSSSEMTLLSMSPHMHLRGQAFRFELEKPDGSREVLLDVPHYDFNWQSTYQLAEPMTLPAGSRMYCTALFDNSERNLANPDPNARVTWGDQSWEEMMIGYFDVMVPKRENGSAAAPITPSLRSQGILARLDKNNDGKLDREEVKGRKTIESFFDQIDTDKDGYLSAEEFSEAINFAERLKR